jgi:hypothetical protein
VPLLLLSGEDGEGVGRQEGDGRRCGRLLSGGGGGCCCGVAGLHGWVCLLNISKKISGFYYKYLTKNET